MHFTLTAAHPDTDSLNTTLCVSVCEPIPLPLEGACKPADAALPVLLVAGTLEPLGEQPQLEVSTHDQVPVVQTGHQRCLAQSSLRVYAGPVAGLRAVRRKGEGRENYGVS